MPWGVQNMKITKNIVKAFADIIEENINEVTRLVEACEYWNTQKIHCQQMIELADKNLIALTEELKNLKVHDEYAKL